jgi:hypothetical protein
MQLHAMTSNRVIAAVILATVSCGGDKITPPEPTPSEQIAEARAAPDGAAYQLVQNVIVTFVKPAVGADPAGFFVQAQRVGPALFIATAPSTLNPVPTVGDEVSFTITTMGTTAGLRQAVGIAGFERTSQANSIAGFVQNVSNRADLVSNVTGYESEIVTVSGTATSSPTPVGTGFLQAGFSTAGVASDPSLKLRVRTTLAASLDIGSGCHVTLDLVPMWRNGTTAQLSAWTSFDIVVSSCPAPNVGGSEAMSATTVEVRFDRLIEPGSVAADGSQFTVPGLTVSGATVDGNTVTLTTTTQTSGLSYTVTVAGTVTDTYGTALNPAANTTTFTGF